jgi:hypothetical protein
MKKTTKNKHWTIKVVGYGSFYVNGSENEAEEMRAHKSEWEGGKGTKRLATEEEIKAKKAL